MSGESQVIATDTILFPVQERKFLDKKEIIPVDINLSNHKDEQKIDKSRFARLKKSQRKRSASIL